MKEKIYVLTIFLGIVVLFSLITDNSTPDYAININNKTITCDGIVVTSNCQKDGILYEKYVYHSETPEIKHEEMKITYTTEIVGYCTLCNDGTRSPSCSVGRGTCSHHGGVREWNAPIYQDVEHKEYVTVVDYEATSAYYEKIIK